MNNDDKVKVMSLIEYAQSQICDSINKERLVTSPHLIIEYNQERTPVLMVVQINQQKYYETSIRVWKQCLEFVTLYTHAQEIGPEHYWRVDTKAHHSEPGTQG